MALLSFVNFQKGSYIIVEGKQDANYFYIINQGKVLISKEFEIVQEEQGNLLGPGDFFGVISTMSSHSHIETAKALTDVVLISVPRGQYGELISKNTPVAMKIILQFSKRLRYLNVALSRLTFKDNDASDSSQLFDIAEFYVRQSRYSQAFYVYNQYLKHFPNGEHVRAAKERVAKIAIYAKGVKLEYNATEMNRSYAKNSMLFAEGEPGNELFIIQSGSVTISKVVNNNEVLLAVLKPGDILGEMAMLESKPRTASAVAYEDCKVMVINRANFELMIKTQPQLISKLTSLLADRIWFMYKQLANTLIADVVGRMYDTLLIHLEKNRIPLDSQGSYTFDFGPRELVTMVGVPLKDVNTVLKKIMTNNKLRVDNDKIHTLSVGEIVKQAELYRKMQKIENQRVKKALT
ncbi:MAG: cyclic nucleotide-binding domain-containing protein [Treponema sp.]|nr:cyclic nucleotide-binding domain-containing protein [Treponema sp.]